MDEIFIEKLECFAHHGVYDFEQKDGQIFFVSVRLFGDTKKAGEADDLSLSTGYGDVARFIVHWMQHHTCKLLETVAEQLSEELLLAFPLVQSLELTIHKPQAPVKIPFADLGVRVKRGWHTAYVALGSNMGDTKGHIDRAIAMLDAAPLVRVKKVSTLRLTPPYGGVAQDDFLNGALCCQTLLPPKDFLGLLNQIEAAEGRTRTVHWGPRTLDLDLLLYDDLIVDVPGLQIPHLEMHKRDFVLEPMNELAPGLVHPVLSKTMRMLYEACVAGKA